MVESPVNRQNIACFIGEKCGKISELLDDWKTDNISDKHFADELRLTERQMVDCCTRLLNESAFMRHKE